MKLSISELVSFDIEFRISAFIGEHLSAALEAFLLILMIRILFEVVLLATPATVGPHRLFDAPEGIMKLPCEGPIKILG